jgi:hypothetical protein
MVSLPKELVEEFLDAVVQDRDRAKNLLSVHPQLIDARWIHNETVVHFLAVEGFTDAVKFLAECGANVNAVNGHPQSEHRARRTQWATVDRDADAETSSWEPEWSSIGK